LKKYYFSRPKSLPECAVTVEPLEAALSLSGVRPKVGVLLEGGRYVGRTRLKDAHIIAKLPVVGQPLLPELEDLSLRLAQAAGVPVVQARLEPLEKLMVEHGYDLGEAAVHDLLRRLAVNEMLGNPDMHLKNIGVIYPVVRTPVLPPAYDIVGYAAYNRRIGHALHILPPGRDIARKPRLSVAHAQAGRAATPGLGPAVVREFCALLGIPEKPAAAAVRQAVAAAAATWPGMIRESALTGSQKERLLAHFEGHPLVASLRKRRAR